VSFRLDTALADREAARSALAIAQQTLDVYRSLS